MSAQERISLRLLSDDTDEKNQAVNVAAQGGSKIEVWRKRKQSARHQLRRRLPL
jgi:hypothetical protein